MDCPTLVATIEAFELDEPNAVDPFSRRLARENGWTDEYARRVLREYKRFLLLAVTSGHAVRLGIFSTGEAQGSVYLDDIAVAPTRLGCAD